MLSTQVKSPNHLATEKNKPASKESQKHKKVMDFVIVEEQYKHTLASATSYQSRQIKSDLRLLITISEIDQYITHWQKNKLNKKSRKSDTQTLVNNWKTQQRYRHESSNQIKKVNINNGKQ